MSGNRQSGGEQGPGVVIGVVSVEGVQRFLAIEATDNNESVLELCTPGIPCDLVGKGVACKKDIQVELTEPWGSKVGNC